MIYKAFAVFALFFIYIKALAAEPNYILQEFKTDYCTMFVEGPPGKPGLWQDCCYDHDLRYWFGGSFKQRDLSDLRLKQCVKEKAGSFYANMMYYAIRTGHYSPIKNKYKWGWGWDPKRDYSELTRDEKNYIIEKLEELELDQEYLREFIEYYSL